MDGCGFGIAASTEEPESKFVKLEAGDESVDPLAKTHLNIASISYTMKLTTAATESLGTIKAMIQGNFVESKGVVNLSQIRAPILEKIVQYMYYKLRYTNTTIHAPEFPIEPHIALELIVSSSFLDC